MSFCLFRRDFIDCCNLCFLSELFLFLVFYTLDSYYKTGNVVVQYTNVCDGILRLKTSLLSRCFSVANAEGSIVRSCCSCSIIDIINNTIGSFYDVCWFTTVIDCSVLYLMFCPLCRCSLCVVLFKKHCVHLDDFMQQLSRRRSLSIGGC